MTGSKGYRSKVDVADYESFLTAAGAPAGDVAWLRNTERDGRTYKCGMWRCGASDAVPYLFAADETFVMIEGILEIVLDDGSVWMFGPGETGSFPKDTDSIWTVKEPVLHFFIQTT